MDRISKKRKVGLAALVAAAAAVAGACGTDPSGPVDGGGSGLEGEPPTCTAPRSVAVVTTDFTTGGAALVDLESWASRPDLTTLHPDAVVRCGCGTVVAVERLGADDLTLLDPRDLAHRAQIPLGRRANPQDLWLDGFTAYVTLHETGEVVAVDLGRGEVVDRLDLTGLADGDGQPEPAAILGSGGKLYVALQLLDRNQELWSPSGPALLAVLRPSPLALEGTIALEGSNPVTSIRPAGEEGVVLIGHAGAWSEAEDGGVERVDLAARRSLGMVATGEELGGSVVDLAMTGEGLFVTVNVPGEGDRLVRLDPEASGSAEVLAEGPSYSLVRVLDDGKGHLLVADRSPAAPGLRVFDLESGLELLDGPVRTGLPPFDICLAPEPVEEGSTGDGGPDGDADADGDGDADGGVAPASAFAAEVVDFEPAEGATFGADRLPDVVLGPPEGAGEGAGSLDVLSLGCGGSVVLRFEPPIADRAGPDLIVFENAFLRGEHVFAEPGQIGLSADGVTFADLPCDPASGLEGCAGVTPVYASSESGVDPTDPTRAGGDAFDMAEVGLDEVSFVRIVDRSADLPAAALWCGADNSGFDLDAVAAVRSLD